MLSTGLVFEERTPVGNVTPTTFEDMSRYGISPVGVATPTWTKQRTGIWLRTYNGATQYHHVDDALTKHLNFTLEKYTVTFWINWVDNTNSQIVVARYELDVSGWEIYLYDAIITQRHHHAGTVIDGHPRTASYSINWTEKVPFMVALVYTGNATDALHYRNGIAVAVTSSAGGLLIPETCPQDLVMGTRYTKDADWYRGQTGKLKIWNRALSAGEVYNLFQQERDSLGVK